MKAQWIVLYVVTAILLVALIVDGYQSKSDILSRKSKLHQAEKENQQLVEAKESLTKNIDSARSLRADVEDDIEAANHKHRLMEESLNAIKERVEGSEELERAVSILEQEYRELVREAKAADLF